MRHSSLVTVLAQRETESFRPSKLAGILMKDVLSHGRSMQKPVPAGWGGMAGQLLPTPKLNTKVSLPSISQGFRQNLTVNHSPCSEGHHDRLPST